MRWSWWSPRTVISWLDRDPWVAVTFTVPLTIVLLGALAGHPILFVFVPPLVLAVLAGVALVAMDFYKGQKREPERQAQVAAGPQKRNRQLHADQARAQVERKPSRLELEAEVRVRAEAAEAEALTAEAEALTVEARAGAKAAEAEALAAGAKALTAEAEALTAEARARAKAAQAEALATEARARAIRLRA